jgi:hypothetical protein
LPGKRFNVKILRVMLIGLLVLGFAGCKEKPEDNKVDLEQINPDDSNDYRYIFRDEIQKDRDRENKRRKNEFNGRRP